MKAPRASRRGVGGVVIGRNEGARLGRALASLQGLEQVIYVDSGSSDDSVALARSRNVEVVALDATLPFTAARARNAGWQQLVENVPDLELIQFLDGDCELVEGWVDQGAETLRADPRLAAVCGRLRERAPRESVFNRLCDLEWDAPCGDVAACGGNALYRVRALDEVGGFTGAMIAGEEPELALRLRRAEWKIRRIAEEMAVHEAAMTRFTQWWKRALRSGYAAAEGASMHGRSPERYMRRRVASIVTWGGVLPLLILGASWPTAGWSLVGLGLYPLQWMRIARKERLGGRAPRDAALLAAFFLVAKFPQMQGVATYAIKRRCRGRARLIEYK